MTQRPRVILRKCDDYAVSRIAGIVGEGATDLGRIPRGRVLIKPNVVTANKQYIHHSYTHPAVTEAVVAVCRNAGAGRIHIGESGGYGIPTRLFFAESGYAALCRRLGVDLVDFNEHTLRRVPLHKGRYHRSMLASPLLLDSDTRIWMPKLKFHIFAGITHCLKLNIGILAHKERMLFHDWRIHDKIVDMLEIGYPHLIVSDAIDITYGFESAPYPVHLGALMISDHPLAADVVAAHIMGYRPEDIEHLKIAADRGYGSLSLDDIDMSGDVDIEALRAIPKGDTGLFQDLHRLDTPIAFYIGASPEPGKPCDGGCECALKGCLGTIEKRSPGALAGARPGAIVAGIYRGDVIMPEAPVLLIGDCTRVDGRVEAKKVHRVKGCPMGARDLFIKVPQVFGMPSPMLDRRDASLFIYHSAMKAMATLKNRMLGR